MDILISQEDAMYVQKANFERDSRRDLLMYILQNNLDVSPEKIAEYKKDYDEKFIEFSKAKNYIEQKYILPTIGNKKCNWKLDYSSQILEVTIDE